MAWNRKYHAIEALTAERDGLQQQVADLSAALDAERAVGEVADLARTEVESEAFQINVREDALSLASVAVVAAERRRLTEELSERLQDEEADRLAAEFRQTEGPKIKTTLTELFESDGTFDRIRDDAEAAVRADLQSEVLTDMKAEVLGELSKPEVQESIKERLREQIAASDEIEAYRDSVRRNNEDRWIDEVEQQVKDEVDTEERAREQAFKTTYAEQFRASDYVTRRRDTLRRDLEGEWTSATEEDVLGQIDDEVLSELARKRAAILTEQAEVEVAAMGLLKKFESTGLDTSEITEGSTLSIFMGDVKMFNTTEKDRYGYDTEVTKKGIECKRQLDLTALGDGKFVVDGDSLLDSDDEYRRNDALHRGTVIMIGRKVRENGEAELGPKVVADVPLYFAEDTEAKTLIDSLLPVANITLNGVKARQDIEIVEMAG